MGLGLADVEQHLLRARVRVRGRVGERVRVRVGVRVSRCRAAPAQGEG